MGVPQQRMMGLSFHLSGMGGLPGEGTIRLGYEGAGAGRGKQVNTLSREKVVQRPWSRRQLGALEMLNKASVGRKQRMRQVN